MKRREFLLSAAAFALPVPPGNEIAFKVLRNGTPIGEHHLNFTQSGGDLTVDINVALLVTFASIPVFRYNLKATEKWSGGVFQSLESLINNNGAQLEVQAHKTAAGYDVLGINHSDPSSSYPEYTAPANTMPLTYWNRAMLNGTILNIQTAHSYPAIVSSPEWDKLPTANGGFIVAQRFDVTGKLHLTVWYDQNNAWSGLEFHVNGDESYQKITA
jgi:hypothetical protein